jgi:hypothetical protein
MHAKRRWFTVSEPTSRSSGSVIRRGQPDSGCLLFHFFRVTGAGGIRRIADAAGCSCDCGLGVRVTGALRQCRTSQSTPFECCCRRVLVAFPTSTCPSADMPSADPSIQSPRRSPCPRRSTIDDRRSTIDEMARVPNGRFSGPRARAAAPDRDGNRASAGARRGSLCHRA